jgi:hypothetical protein
MERFNSSSVPTTGEACWNAYEKGPLLEAKATGQLWFCRAGRYPDYPSAMVSWAARHGVLVC